MLPEHYEEVKELIERIADYYGPVEEDPLLEEQTAEMRRLTGRDQGHDLPTSCSSAMRRRCCPSPAPMCWRRIGWPYFK